MDALIRELESLKSRPDIPAPILGAMLAIAARCKEKLGDRDAGLEALAGAVAMQPGIDIDKLQSDFWHLLTSHFESPRHVPVDLKDVYVRIKLAGAERE